MANKVRFGLRKVGYALVTATDEHGVPTYAESYKQMPGAVSLSLSVEGGDNTDFYADDGVYYTFAGTNGGYSAEIEFAYLSDEIRAELLGEVVDETAGIQFETTEAKPPIFAMVFETQGDANPIGFTFYSCKASRPELNANTQNDSPDVDTTTLSVRMTAMTLPYKGERQGIVQSHIEKTAENAAKYAAFFESVVVPTATVEP